MRLLKTLALLVGLSLAAIQARAASFYDFRVYHSTATGVSTGTIGGYIQVAPSSSTVGSPTITLNGQAGRLGIGVANPLYSLHDAFTGIPTVGVLNPLSFFNYNSTRADATSIPTAIYALCAENSSVATTTGHMPCGIFRSSDTAAGRTYLIGGEFRTDAFGIASNYDGGLSYLLYTGTPPVSTVLAALRIRAQVTTDGTTPNPAGDNNGLIIESLTGGATGKKHAITQQGTADINQFLGPVAISTTGVIPGLQLQVGAGVTAPSLGTSLSPWMFTQAGAAGITVKSDGNETLLYADSSNGSIIGAPVAGQNTQIWAGGASRININGTTGKVGISSAAATDELSVGGSVNVATGYKTGTVAGSNTTCSVGQAILGETIKGGISTGGTCTTVSLTTNTNPQPAWEGYNYWLGGSSGTVVAYSTGAINATGIDSFHVVDSSWVVAGVVCHTNDTTYSTVRSTVIVVWLDTNCALQSTGLTSMSWVNFSSMTTLIGDGIAVAISTFGSAGDAHAFQLANDLPIPSYAGAWAGRGGTTNTIGTSAGAEPQKWMNCASAANIFTACSTNSLALVPMSAGRGHHRAEYSGTSPDNSGASFIVNNAGSGSQNITISNLSAAAWQYSIDGNGLVNIAAGTNSTSAAVGTGRHIIILQGAGEGGIGWSLPPNMKFVRPGPM